MKKDTGKKRSFQLSDSSIEKLYLLKAKNHNKTLSEIVNDAIILYYQVQVDDQ